MILITSVYILLLFILFILIGVYYKRYQKIDVFVIFTLVYSLYYFLVPVIITINQRQLEQESNGIDYVYHIINTSTADRFYALVYSILGYLIFAAAYKFTPTKYRTHKISINTLQLISIQKLRVVFRGFGFFMFIAGGLSFVYIIISLGGLSRALQLADYLRNPNVDSTQYLSQNVLFLKTLGGLTLGAPYAFLGAYYIKREKTTLMLFISSLALGTLYAVFSAGKFVLVTFTAGFIIHYLIRGKRTKILNIIIFSVICLWLIPFIDFLFSYLATGGERGYGEHLTKSAPLISQFAFPYSNLLKVQEINQIFGLRWGIDLVNWTWNIIPSGILGILGLRITPDLSDQITLYYSMFSKSTGGTPADLLTLVISQFSVFGVFLMAIVGFILKKVNLLLSNLNFNDFSFLYFSVLIIPYSLVFNSELVNILKYRMSNVMILIMLLAASRLIVKNSYEAEDLTK